MPLFNPKNVAQRQKTKRQRLKSRESKSNARQKRKADVAESTGMRAGQALAERGGKGKKKDRDKKGKGDGYNPSPPGLLENPLVIVGGLGVLYLVTRSKK